VTSTTERLGGQRAGAVRVVEQLLDLAIVIVVAVAIAIAIAVVIAVLAHGSLLTAGGPASS
jgi:uncharacterized RDD family membrane protein YckC